MSLSLPANYSRIRMVSSFAELIAAPFGDGVNAFCWARTLAGDFGEVVAKLEETGNVGLGTEGGDEGIRTLTDARLRSLSLSADGQVARDILLADQEYLRARGRAPVLDCIDGYLRDEPDAIVPTDVYSFHADSAPVEAETWLCTYHGAWSEGLRNDEAHRRVDIPETRARLFELFGGTNEAEFREWLSENCFDLHYSPTPDAQPFGFGLGNLWRIAVDWPGSPVPPCIHRAPDTRPGDAKRLLLIS